MGPFKYFFTLIFGVFSCNCWRNNEFKLKINSFIESKQNIFTTYQEIASLVKSCANVALLSQEVFQAVQSVNEMTNAIHRIVEGIRGGKIEQADVDLAQAFQDRTLECLDIIKAGVGKPSPASK